LRIYSVRKSGEDRKYVRITNFLLPNKTAIVGNEGRIGEGYTTNWHVPVDDDFHMRFDITFNRVKAIDIERYDSRSVGEVTLDHHLVRNQRNRYLQNRAAMTTDNFTGMGNSFIVHDAYAVETAGPIHDRTREHLGTTDIIIAQARQLLLEGMEAVESGKAPIHVNDTDMDDLVVCSVVVPQDMDHKEVAARKGVIEEIRQAGE
jgi:hypothetical protein